jgi:hypothetical protein
MKYKIIIPKEEPKNQNNQEVMFHKEHQEYFYEDIVDGKLITVWLGKDYVPKEKSKQETPEEETLNKIKFVLSCGNDTQAIRLLEQYGQWQQERSYSEEDMKQFGLYISTNFSSIKGKTVDEIFEQFKKKEWKEIY